MSDFQFSPIPRWHEYAARALAVLMLVGIVAVIWWLW